MSGERGGKKRRDFETAAYGGLWFAMRRFGDRLQFQKGFKLNSKPREIDCVIIDRLDAAKEPLDGAIAHLFRKHNIVELKNPREALNIDTVWKGISYAAQYKSAGGGVDLLPMEDVTLTFLRVSRPRGLFNTLRKYGYGVEERFAGVYYLTGLADIRMQVVVGAELDGEEFVPLRVQKGNASEADIQRYVNMVRGLAGSEEREMADHILQIAISENKKMFERMRKEDERMCVALEELMADVVEAREEQAYNRAYDLAFESGREEGLELGREEGIELGREEGLELGQQKLNQLYARYVEDNDIDGLTRLIMEAAKKGE